MPANDYRSWTFTDRPFFFALTVSALWHLLWFLMVTIVVAPPRRKPQVQPAIVSLGPVLNDAIFKTLVETRPEISKAFYRQPQDIASATEAPAETLPRYEAGGVVSVPQGKGFVHSLKALVSGAKAEPEAGLPTLMDEEQGTYFEFYGRPEGLQVLSRPPEPADLPAGAVAATEIEFSIDPRGQAIDLEVVQSCGDATLDRVWEEHLSQWIFAEGGAFDAAPARLRVRFRAASPGAP